jgi:hypothetical protein
VNRATNPPAPVSCKSKVKPALEVHECFDPPSRRFFVVAGGQRTEIDIDAALGWVVNRYVPQAFKPDFLAMIATGAAHMLPPGGAK